MQSRQCSRIAKCDVQMYIQTRATDAKWQGFPSVCNVRLLVLCSRVTLRVCKSDAADQERIKITAEGTLVFTTMFERMPHSFVARQCEDLWIEVCRRVTSACETNYLLQLQRDARHQQKPGSDYISTSVMLRKTQTQRNKKPCW